MRRIISVLAIAALIAAMTAVGALPAFAQQQPGPPTLTATGVLGAPFFEGQDPEPLYPLTDEATGTTYTLIGSFVDVTPFVGQRVTIQGVAVPGIDPYSFFVTQIQPAPALGGGPLPGTGGPPLLVPSVALIVGSGVLGTAVLLRRRRGLLETSARGSKGR